MKKGDLVEWKTQDYGDLLGIFIDSKFDWQTKAYVARVHLLSRGKICGIYASNLRLVAKGK